jgi:predicted 3-demethylubiquinone-9 3-methyltransferase (glyoxalase superfamily)
VRIDLISERSSSADRLTREVASTTRVGRLLVGRTTIGVSYSEDMAPLTTCLWFNGCADEAVDFYLSIFPNAKRVDRSVYPDEAPGDTGSTWVIDFELDGSSFMALNAGNEFRFSPATSFVVLCDTQEEIDAYWRQLGDGGTEMQCGWLTDKYGVCWQIVPKVLRELLATGDEDVVNRVTKSMMTMAKLDIAALQAASR